jgi:hypothetical protein
MSQTDRTINQVMDDFLSIQRDRVKQSTAKRYEDVLDYFRSCMDGYGHQWLSEKESELFERQVNRDEEAGSFCNLFGPEKILENLDEFVGWFLVRKTMASKSTLEATPAVLRKLVKWLVEEGHVSPDAADGSVELLAEAGSLPKAEEFSSRLYKASEGDPPEPLIEDQDWVDEMALVTRVDHKTIWLQNESTGYEVALLVPEYEANLAEPGWRISALHIARTPKGWHLLEMGNVYPM